MNLDNVGITFMHDNEGCRLKAYLDTGMVPTIGWGSIWMFGNRVRLGMTCTQAEADDQFLLDVKLTEKCINKSVTVPLTQNQYNALVDFVYNVGVTAFNTSTLLKKLNLKDYQGAADQFMRWIYDNGKEVDGLKKRRKRTRELWMI